MSSLLRLLELRAGEATDSWIGPASGPPGKRSYGGQFVAQSLAAAWRTVEAERMPTNMHLQFLRGGEASDDVDYRVARVFDGRTSSVRRVDAHQQDRLLTTAMVSFAVPMRGPEHGRRRSLPQDPLVLARTGPAGPALSMPLDELDIRIADQGSGEGFTRRLWWRATVPLPDDPKLHALIAVYVSDVYMIDPALKVHGHSMQARTHRSGTTDSAIWFHQSVFADQWNLFESMSPAAARGRGVVTGSLVRADGVVAATMAQEGLIAERD